MADRPAQTPAQTPAKILGVSVRDPSWFRPLGRQVYLAAGARAPQPLRVPVGDALLLLRGTVHTVTGQDAGATDVVFTAGRDELLIHTKGIGLACVPGAVTIGIPVRCDQLPDGGLVQVAFAVGTAEKPTGLIMVTHPRPVGPPVVVDAWGESLVAFAWEALLHLAGSLCRAAGADAGGKPLVPGYLSAERDLLILQPMAAHA